MTKWTISYGKYGPYCMGCIFIDGKSWRRNLLVTRLRCWWQVRKFSWLTWCYRPTSLVKVPMRSRYPYFMQRLRCQHFIEFYSLNFSLIIMSFFVSFFMSWNIWDFRQNVMIHNLLDCGQFSPTALKRWS